MEICSIFDPNLCQNILSAEDANILLWNKENINYSHINIRGKISSLSEIFRVSKDKLYMVMLDDILKIVILQEEYKKWHMCLSPGSNFVFMSLKPALLKKGVDVPFKVYLPTSRSCVFKDNETVNPYSLTDWLNDNKIDREKLVISDTSSNIKSSPNLFSYQGTVENVISAEFGIYNLDGCILLYTCHLPGVNGVKCLDVGTEIVVYNVHHCGRKEYPRICLYCCAKSNINVVNKLTCTSTKYILRHIESSKSWVRHMINAFKLDREETQHLKHIFETVYSICNSLKRAKYDVIKVLQGLLSETGCTWLQSNPRNIIQEFFVEPHQCFFTDKVKESRIPTLMTGERLLEKAYSGASDLSRLHNKFKDSNLVGKDLCELVYWTYDIQACYNTKEIIIGWLELCKTTGRLVLRDSQSKIDVIVSSLHPITNHVCEDSCVKLSEESNCPYIQISKLGRIISLSKYNVISERFINGSFTNIDSICKENVDEFQHFPYLQFSMTDCKCISPTDNISKISIAAKSEVSNSHLYFDSTPGNIKIIKRTHSPAVEVDLNGKCFKTAPHSSNMFQIQNSCQGDMEKTVWITHKESLITKTKNMETSLIFSALGCIVHSENKCVSSKMTNASEVFQSDILRYEPVELVFQGDSVKWYDLINSGALYKFSRLIYLDYKVQSSMQTCVKKSVQRSKTRRSVSVPVDALISRTFLNHQLQAKEDNLIGIGNILSDSCRETLVSLVGRIISRKHCESGLPPKGIGFNEKKLKTDTQRCLGVSMIGNQCVQLQIKALDSDDAISVYLKLERTSYPLGLIHGTTVEFERLERKLSKRGTIYCHYTPVSSYRIISFQINSPDSGSQEERDNDKQFNIACVKQKYILETVKLKDSRPFNIHCHIYQILNLRLECVCCVCSIVCKNSKCSSPCCRNVTFKITGKISFLIDDGSTVAKTFLILDNVKTKTLLNLNEDEFECLMEEIQEIGEININNFLEHQDTSIALFLQKLCNSSTINKSWSMTLRPFYSQDLRQMSSKDLEVRNVHVGGTTVETRCLPYWTLECLHLQNINYSTAVYNI